MSENKCPICGSELVKLEPVQCLGWGCNFQCNPEDFPCIAAAMDAKARHNALVEACHGLLGAYRNGEFQPSLRFPFVVRESASRIAEIARAEVDRLIAEGERKMSTEKEYFEEGDKCPCSGCDGKLRFGEVQNCSCHISPPCEACVNNKLTCPACYWVEDEEIV